MKTGNVLKVCGSVIKKESLVYLTDNKLENTTIAEADQPYSNYYGQIPKKPEPNSLFLFTDAEYSLEEALRFTQNIDICAKNKVNAASAVVFSAGSRIPAIRIRNFPDYQHLIMLQECYQAQGVRFVKRNIPEREPIIKVSKCFYLEDAGDGYYFDLDEEHEGYFTIPYYPDLSDFEILLQNVRNNSSCSLFDAAYGGLIVEGKVMDMIRIYSGHMSLNLLRCIRQEAFKWIKTKSNMQHMQGSH
jgi:hypothetical protein